MIKIIKQELIKTIIFQPYYIDEHKNDFLCWTFYNEKSSKERKLIYLKKDREEFIKLCQEKFKEFVYFDENNKPILNETPEASNFIKNFLEILKKEDIFDEVFTNEFCDKYIGEIPYRNALNDCKNIRNFCNRIILGHQ